MYGMFEDCSKLTYLNMSGLDVSRVEATESYDAGKSPMFGNCPSLKIIYVPQGLNVSTALPVSESPHAWFDSDGNEITELPMGLDSSVMICRFPAAVKYVPYEVNIQDGVNSSGAVYRLTSGFLPQGIELRSDGVIKGVPLEAGKFRIIVERIDGSGNLEESIEYILLVRENSNKNVNEMSDSGYELIEYVPDLYLESFSENGSHTLVSRGEYSEFEAVYLNGRKLTEGTDYTSESGSTRITIIDQTLTNEGEGTHTIGIEFRTANNILRRAAQNYTVLAGKAPGENDNNSNTNGGGNDNSYVQPPAEPVEETTETEISYVVQRGDTLWKLAVRYYGAGRFWTKIYEDNRESIRSPHRLSVGQVLTIYLTDADAESSDADEGMDSDTYTVKSGDNLWNIARKYYGKGSLWQWIYQANQDKISNPGRIWTGQVFTIPGR